MVEHEPAIARWRMSLVAQGSLRAEHLDELEAHLRDELDALAEVGIHGEEAFEHATEKLGSSSALGDEFARGHPAFAWRSPLFLIVTGALFSLVGAAGAWLAHGLGSLLSVVLRLDAQTGSVALVAGTLLPPLMGIAVLVAGSRALLPRSGARTFRSPTLASKLLWSALRVGAVVGVALFVLMAIYFPLPSSFVPMDPKALVIQNGWWSSATFARHVIERATPIVVALLVILSRRFAGRGRHPAPFWALLGVLLHGLWCSFDRALYFAFSACCNLAHLAPHAAARLAYVVHVGVPVALVCGVLLVLRRLPPPRVVLASSRGDWAWLSLGAASTLFYVLSSWGYRALHVDFGNLSPAISAEGDVQAAFAALTPAILAVLALHLRSRIAVGAPTAADA